MLSLLRKKKRKKRSKEGGLNTIMKLSFNLENINDPDNKYLEQFDLLNDKIKQFRTSYNINTILINIYLALDIIKELEKEYIYMKDLFIDHFRFDIIVYKFKFNEILELIKMSGISMDHADTYQMHEMIDLVLRQVKHDEIGGYAYMFNSLEWAAAFAQSSKDYKLAAKRYSRFIKYLNKNIYLQSKIDSATKEMNKCIAKI